jgi:hypothetical protein
LADSPFGAQLGDVSTVGQRHNDRNVVDSTSGPRGLTPGNSTGATRSGHRAKRTRRSFEPVDPVHDFIKPLRDRELGFHHRKLLPGRSDLARTLGTLLRELQPRRGREVLNIADAPPNAAKCPLSRA